MRIIRCLFLILFLVLAPACGLIVEEGREALAKVDGEPIRLNELLKQVRSLPFDQRARTNSANAKDRLEARRSILETLVIERLLLKEAQARGVEVSEEEALEILEAQEESRHGAEGVEVEGMKDTSAGHEHGHGEGFSRTQIREMRERLLIDKMLKELLSDEALAQYYNSHTEEFVHSPPLISLELMVAKAEDAAVIDTIREKAIQDETSLAKALKAFLEPPPLVFAGITPLIPLKATAPPMVEKIEGLQVGEISEPFNIKPGGQEQYGVARVVDFRDKVPLENAKPKIRRTIYEGLLEELRGKYEVIYYEDKLDYTIGR